MIFFVGLDFNNPVSVFARARGSQYAIVSLGRSGTVSARGWSLVIDLAEFVEKRNLMESFMPLFVHHPCSFHGPPIVVPFFIFDRIKNVYFSVKLGVILCD